MFTLLAKLKHSYGPYRAPYDQRCSSHISVFWPFFENFKNNIFAQALVGASVQALQAVLYGRRDIYWSSSEKKIFLAPDKYSRLYTRRRVQKKWPFLPKK